MKQFLFYLTTIISLLFIGSCSSDENEETQYYDLFQNVADNIIIPRYTNFDESLSDLISELNNFDSTELSSLEILQEKFINAYLSWQKVSAFEFGPAGETSALLRSNINTFPTNLTKIESNIQNNDYNLDAASNFSAKGFPALDYLLFHTSQSDLLIELMNESRITYMKNCLMDMQSKLDYVINGWDTYRNVFVESEGNDQSSSLSLLFNHFLFDYEQLKRNKFALPSGFATSFGIPISSDPSKVEGFYSGKSFDLIYANLTALENIYMGIGVNGVDGVGIYEMLKEYNAVSTVVEGDLSEAIADQFVICKELINEFSNDLSYEILNNISQVQETSNELQKMVPMIKNDMRSYFSVTVTLGDSDGD